MKFRLIRKQHESDNAWSLYFKPEKPYRFIEGQFLEISLPHADVDSRGVRRWFSISSSSSDEYIRITTKNLGDKSTFKTALFNLEIGQEIIGSSAMGDFVLPKDITTPLIFVAIGIGITPFMSILSKANHEVEHDINLIYQVKNTQEYLFKNEINDKKLAKFVVTDQKLTTKTVVDFTRTTDDPLYYLAGPELFVENLTKQLVDIGIESSRIITDYFPGYN